MYVKTLGLSHVYQCCWKWYYGLKNTDKIRGTEDPGWLCTCITLSYNQCNLESFLFRRHLILLECHWKELLLAKVKWVNTKSIGFFAWGWNKEVLMRNTSEEHKKCAPNKPVPIWEWRTFQNSIIWNFYIHWPLIQWIDFCRAKKGTAMICKLDGNKRILRRFHEAWSSSAVSCIDDLTIFRKWRISSRSKCQELLK